MFGLLVSDISDLMSYTATMDITFSPYNSDSYCTTSVNIIAKFIPMYDYLLDSIHSVEE